jgi:Low affinity iron permease
LIWAVTGPVFHYSETWQLVINTGTTIVTFLMVFLIQNTQNRDGAAIQAKLDVDKVLGREKRVHRDRASHRSRGRAIPHSVCPDQADETSDGRLKGGLAGVAPRRCRCPGLDTLQFGVDVIGRAMLESDDFVSCGVESDNNLIQLRLHCRRIAGILDQHHAGQR